MWEISNSSQALNFLYSIILGLIFASAYDFFRSLRIVKSHTAIMVFFEDVIYFSVLSMVTFVFLLSVTNGEVRGYVLFGIIIGFLFFIFTVSKYYIIALTFLLKVFFKAINLFLKGFYVIFGKIDCVLSVFLINTLKYSKKCLKKLIGLLYTNSKSN